MTRTSSERSVDSVPLVPPAGGPYSLQLVLSGSEDTSGDPFVLLSSDEDFARVYLAVIKGDPETVVDYCAVKVLRNVYRSEGFDERLSSSNAAIEERWRFETERIEDFRSATESAPRLILPDSQDGPGMLPPMFLCRTGRRLFAAPCPRCGSTLATCRDDSLLAKFALPLYSGSLQRFLYCRRCSDEDPETPFYAFEAPAGDRHRLVLTAEDYFRDLGEALVGAAESQVHSEFPCRDCLEAARQFQVSLGSGVRTSPFWEDRWVPLNFFDSPYVVTGFGAFSLVTLSELLGGRTDDTLGKEASGSAWPSSSSRLRYPGEGELSTGSGRLLFESDGSGMDAVEVLLLKLVAFRQTTEAVLEYSRAFGRPHVDLHPRHVLFDLSRAGSGLPWLWGFRSRLHGLASAARPARLAGNVEVLIPPRNPCIPYASPEVLEFHLAVLRSAQLVLSELEEVTRGPQRGFRLHGKLTDSYGIYPSPRGRDWVLVTLDNDALGLSQVEVPSRQDPRVQTDDHELAFISEPVVLKEATVQQLKKSLGVRIPGARYKIYSDFGVASDLYSLGMMLLGLLLGNDRQDAKAIATEVERAAKHISTSAGRRVPGPDLIREASAYLERDPQAARAFAKTNIFYQEIDRAASRPNAVPDALWKRAILLGLRLASRVNGFSFCADPSDYDESHPTAKLEALLQEVDLLTGELQTLLFHRQAAHVEIQQVLSEIVGQPTVDSGRESPG